MLGVQKILETFCCASTVGRLVIFTNTPAVSSINVMVDTRTVVARCLTLRPRVVTDMHYSFK